GLFVVNEHGDLHVVDISNNPFVRPELGALSRGLAWIRDPNNNYPIRGTLDY
ncbi:thioredoxin peroxidase, partial [Vibrio parahaemolyticus]|nr:thioredoxin peroxidase [Vibrio parahaemolyticus]